MDLPTILFYQPIFNLLTVFYRVFDLALAVILVALVLRIILYPLTRRQMGMQQKMASVSKQMNSRIEAAKKEHKDDKEKQDQAILKIQQEFLPQQLGCFAMFGSLILQSLFFVGMYHMLLDLFREGLAAFNRVAYPFVPVFPEGAALNTQFLRIFDLSVFPGQQTEPTSLIVYAIFPLLAAISQYISIWLSMKMQQTRKEQEQAEEKKDKKDKQKDERSPDEFGDIANRLNRQMSIFFAAMVFVFGLNLPVGLSLYWTVQSAFVIIQQFIWNRNHDRARAEQKS